MSNISGNTSVKEVIMQVMNDPNATDREKFFVKFINSMEVDEDLCLIEFED